MQFIVACTKNWAIGKSGKMLFHLPHDLAFFRRVTYGHVVVMGRKTYESLPGKKALEGRVNIILSKNKDYEAPDSELVHSKEELFALLAQKYQKEKVFLIGGGTLYHDLLEACSGGYVTHIDTTIKDADTYFPNLDEKENWQKNALMQTENDGHLAFQIWHYENLEKEEADE